MTKRTLFIATKSRLFATLATAGVMVGGVAGLEAQATGQVSAELSVQATATELAQRAASIDRFAHPTSTTNSAAAPTVTSQVAGTAATQTAAPSTPTANAVVTPTTPAPPAPPVVATNGTSGGSK